ncbi:hypothetical protein X915_gp074 [Bacillus phage vB_BanS-Tsamsa]|uniref:Uncharacterized protein n=1 Tax=Bacillus phage vB_BanS-Tsamsa TaxID=1308863 RepID=U5J9G0_9CAUD|nr:hypothetical protein X915_gp074 [Bacillus phage vB_BanS-Tsamsa]AGI11877.1 hypothetical protein [Bacillus phage vB_BanS-Tsamsa]
MRDLQSVKGKRDFLRNVFAKATARKEEVLDGRNFRDLDEYEKSLIMEINKAIDKLMPQIEALTFVLNEDSEICPVLLRVGRGLSAGEVMGSTDWYADESKYN